MCHFLIKRQTAGNPGNALVVYLIEKEQRADDSMFRWRGDDPLETLMIEAFGATKCQGGATAPLFAGYLMGYTGDIMGYFMG